MASFIFTTFALSYDIRALHTSMRPKLSEKKAIMSVKSFSDSNAGLALPEVELLQAGQSAEAVNTLPQEATELEDHLLQVGQ